MVSDEFHDMDVFGRIAGENGYRVDQMKIDTSHNHNLVFRVGSRSVVDLRPPMTHVEYDVILTEILI